MIGVKHILLKKILNKLPIHFKDLSLPAFNIKIKKTNKNISILYDDYMKNNFTDLYDV